MLTDAVLEGGGMSRFLKPRAAGRTIAGLARHPRRAPRDSAGFGVELARAAARAGDLKPAPKTLGRKHKATAKAPGNYVHAS